MSSRLKFSVFNQALIIVCVCTVATLVRLGVGLYPYSGAGKRPLYGDYEAQRHWMEITYNLPPSEWYQNSSNNDLLYWGLDYPPLTAYHSWLCGLIAHYINPAWVALYDSRGFESYQHKLFMRYSVLFGDFVLYFPAILMFVFLLYRGLPPASKLSTSFLLLLSPGLILIDHGHFQYNSISLGLVVLATIAAVTRHYCACCVAFALALNFKQMELYHALPFFCFLLGRAFQQKKWFLQVVKYGVCVLATFIICWLPFVFSLSQILQVLRRLFPFARGIFEDKVASFWCSVSVFIKLKNIFSVTVLAQTSLVMTLLSILPSAINLLLDPSSYHFLLSLVNSSLGFFLFSFQVHEKSILLVTVPVSLVSVIHPFACTWFSLVATLSMYPLLVKDGLAMPTWSLCGFFCLASYLLLPNINHKNNQLTLVKRSLFHISILSLVSLCILSHFVVPPARYPDLFPVLISGVSCIHFIGFLLFFTYTQLNSQSTTYKTVMKTPVFKKNN